MARSTAPTASGTGAPAVGAQGRPLRKDAQRTRALVLDTARTLFAEHGIDVSFDEIARAAGVGVGTVYRRFPDRESLIDALFADKIEKLLALVEQAEQVSDPWGAVVAFVQSGAEQMRKDRALAEVVMCASNAQAVIEHRRDEITDAVTRLLRRAQDSGAVRCGVEATDLAFFSHVVSVVGVHSGPEAAQRYVTMVLDAIRARPDSADLPGHALSVEDLQEILQRV